MNSIRMLESCASVLLLGSLLQTCSINDDRTQRAFETEFFSTSYEDRTISIVRSRHLYSCNPIQWENPVPSDNEIWENPEWVSMSNLYAIVVNDSKAEGWVFLRGSAECPYFWKTVPTVGNLCIYNAVDDILKSYDVDVADRLQTDASHGHVVDGIIDIDKLFCQHKQCPCVYFGNGKNGVSFWRNDIEYAARRNFITLLWAGKPTKYYVLKQFKTWKEFLEWDGKQ